ncbi:MAG: hypothetical protein COB67_05180 [SAR324 cluster bacterium]|uniref:Uncharacterized protein n=1 Tax=SAR324 cluster bacterium TaxID=2024889 RepID=A0A2A4T624_9DELT|nr:MAG: hypothetical protein COB67_05180 [SAR324 cluster bacterium]
MKKKSEKILSHQGASIHRLLLFHGNRIHSVQRTADFREVLNEQLGPVLKEKAPTLLLLGAPWVFSYIHETIHLKGRELMEADVQVLPFSIIPPERRWIQSIQVTEKKSITIHSHLTDEGVRLLRKLRKHRRARKWQPALPFFVENILAFPQKELRQEPLLQCFWEEEALQVTWSSSVPVFQLLNNYQVNPNFEEKKKSLQVIFNPTEEQPAMLEVSFFEDKPQINRLGIVMAALCFPVGEQKRFKINRRSGGITWYFLKKLVHPLSLIVAGILGFLLWAAIVNYQYFTLRSQQEKLLHEIVQLQETTQEHQQVALIEQSYFKQVTLVETIQDTNHDLEKVFTLIEKGLQGRALWISYIHIREAEVEIALLSEKGVDPAIPKLLKELTFDQAPARLIEEKEIPYQTKGLKQYVIRVNLSADVVFHED